MLQRTLLILKPEVLQRGLVGEIINRFERKGYKIVGLDLKVLSRSKLKLQYEHLSDKPFYAGYIMHLISSPSVLAVLEGEDAVEGVRVLIGNTDPSRAVPGTIRFDYGLDIQRNLIHASASSLEALEEISLWFGDRVLPVWNRSVDRWIDHEEVV